MQSTFRSVLFCALLVLSFSPARAAFSILSDQLDGNEATVTAPETCNGPHQPVGYAAIGPMTVTVTGSYEFVSVFHGIGIDVYFAIYDGEFDPSRPDAHRIASQDLVGWIGAELAVEVRLEEGVEYQLLVSPWCQPEQGTWIVAVNGPGAVNSPATRLDLDPVTAGSFSANDPVADIDCQGPKQYVQSGPHRVLRSGRYYLVDASYYFGHTACVYVFTAPLDLSNPSANRIATLNGYQSDVELLQARDYYFVVQPRTIPGVAGSCCHNPRDPQAPREYLFVLAPASEIYLDSAFTGNWFDPATPGQGFFLEVYPHLDQVFLGWFTFDLERPAATAGTQLGDPGHRWLTALGGFDRNEALLDIEVTRGGVFNSPAPPTQQAPDGQIELTMHGCTAGEIRFDLGTAGRAGVIPIERLVADPARVCESRLSAAAPPRRVLAD